MNSMDESEIDSYKKRLKNMISLARELAKNRETTVCELDYTVAKP